MRRQQHQVLYVGTDDSSLRGELQSDADHFFETSVISHTEAVDALDSADFDAIVCDHPNATEDSLEILSAIRAAAPSIPIVFRSVEPDGALAAEATRRGATDYVARDGTDTLGDRLDTILREPATTSQSSKTARLQESQDALQQLYEITSRTGQRFEDKLDEVLELGCDRLRLSYGYLTRVDDDEISIEQSLGLAEFEGDSTPIDYTYCRETVENDQLVTIVDTTAGRWADSKPTDAFDMQCYLGGRVLVDGDLYGTLCFTDTDPRSQPFTEDQKTLVELIVQWISYELERRRHESMLTSLLETTRSLMQAPTKQAVADEIVEAARDVLGFELNLVRLYDSEAAVLRPAACTEETLELMGERPAYESGEGVPGEVFETGEIVFYSEKDSLSVDIGDAGETVCLPLGEYGTLTLSSYTTDQFDQTDRQVAEILAANAEAALARADRAEELTRYESVIESVQDMVFVLDEVGRCTLATNTLAERLGTEREWVIGEHATEFIETTSDESFAEVYESLLADPERDTADIDARVIIGYGQTFPATVSLSLLPGDRFQGVVGVVTDLTELAETQAELEDQRDRFGYLFENLPDAVLEVEIIDNTPIIRSTNQAFADVFGWDGDGVVGESLIDLIVPEDDRDTGASLARRAAAGEIIQKEVRRETVDGLRYFLFRGIPFDTQSETTRAFAIYTDITEQRARQRQLQVLNRVFRHNLRNDLTVVLGVANHLRDTLEDPELVALVDSLLSKANGLSGLSETVRKIEQTVSHGTTPGSVDAVALLEDVLESHRDSYPDADITLDTPDSLLVSADDHLKTAFDQIVENGFKHSTEPVRLTCRVDPPDAGHRMASITIRDNGPGIPETERVVNDAAEIDPLNHASGLGLWLARWIVVSYGGSMEFDVEMGEGSTVVLSLPVVEV